MTDQEDRQEQSGVGLELLASIRERRGTQTTHYGMCGWSRGYSCDCRATEDVALLIAEVERLRSVVEAQGRLLKADKDRYDGLADYLASCESAEDRSTLLAEFVRLRAMIAKISAIVDDSMRSALTEHAEQPLRLIRAALRATP